MILSNSKFNPLINKNIHMSKSVIITSCLMVVFWFTLAFKVKAEAVKSSSEIWSQFTRELELAGLKVLEDYPQPTLLDESEGLRYLLQQLSTSVQNILVRESGEIPLLRVGATTINKWGMDGADAKYQGAPIDPSGEYLFSGRLGTARLTAIQLSNLTSGNYQAFESLSGDQFQSADSGEFQVLLSVNKPEYWHGPWLPLRSETTDLLVREYFGDWENEEPGDYRLQRLDSTPTKSPLTLTAAEQLLADTVTQFSQRAPQWKTHIDQARKHLVNKVVMRKTAQGLENNYYGSAWFRISNDEALVIELEDPQALLWSVQLGNVWWESLDYINHTASYNDYQAVASSDGIYRFVLSQKDPGVANWLDPVGHSEGALLFRIQGASSAVQPKIELTSIGELPELLLNSIPVTTKEARLAQIEVRRAHAAARWAP